MRSILILIALLASIATLDAQIRADQNVFRRNLEKLTQEVEKLNARIASGNASVVDYCDRGYAIMKRAYYTGKKSEYRKAHADFSAAIAANKPLPEAYLGRGLAQCQNLSNDKKNKHRKAIKDFEQVLKMEENHVDALCYLAFAHMKFEHEDKFYYANFYLDMAQDVDPTNKTVPYFRGLLNYIQQDYRDAIACWDLVEDNSLALFPKIGLTAHSHYMLGEWNEAFTAFQESSWRYESYLMIRLWDMAMQIQ